MCRADQSLSVLLPQASQPSLQSYWSEKLRQKSSKKYVAFEKAGEPFTAPIAGTPAVGASMLSKLTTYLLLLARVFS
jgi:hypothetical protein